MIHCFLLFLALTFSFFQTSPVEAVDLDLYVRGVPSVKIYKDGRWGAVSFQPIVGEPDLRRATVPSSVIKASGVVSIRPSLGTTGVYLTGATDVARTLSNVRQASLAYWIRDPAKSPLNVAMSLNSHRAKAAAAVPGLRDLFLDGEKFASVKAKIGNRSPGETVKLLTTSKGDYIECAVSFLSVKGAPAAKKVEIILESTLPISTMEVLTNKTPPELAGKMLVHQLEGTCAALLSQSPFIAVRRTDGSYLGVLDSEVDDLIAEADSASNEIRIQKWIVPSAGKTYSWKFRIIPGYEPYANAFLRAFQPMTAGFVNTTPGAISGGKLARNQDLDFADLYQAGIRSIWWHGWFYRNGLYFSSQQPMDQEYVSIWGKTYSYNKLKQIVDSAHAAGLKIFIYFQFSGVSEDIMDQFTSSLVLGPDGQPIIAGIDGGINNIWANPNPARPYAASVLQQMDDLLSAIEPDGIALDCTGRQDGRYGIYSYDWGTKEDVGAPFTPETAVQLKVGKGTSPVRPDIPIALITDQDMAHPEVGSITLSGKKFMQSLRSILDKHGVKVISNGIMSPAVTKTSDAHLIDRRLNPWEMLYLKGITNGKAMFTFELTGVVDTTPSAVFFATLFQVQPFSDGADPFDGNAVPPRLLYIIPNQDTYPSQWLFSDGSMSNIKFVYSKPTVAERYAGSTHE
ncbi:MAG: hypothetical protein WAW37_20700 [Syntrophobacteraceae bacterium]